MQNTKFWIASKGEKKVITSLVEKGNIEERNNPKFTIISFESFYKLLSEDEIAICKKYLAIDPKKIGYKLPFLGFHDTPNNLVEISNQSFTLEGKVETIPTQYIPKNIYDAFIKLMDAMEVDIKKRVLVEWGNRSPARQVHNFFKFFQYYKFDSDRTVSRVCFPAYSEHVCAQRQALDFITTEGIDDDFDKTPEYKWLQVNAHKFGFYESYPKDNKVGMMYEPWHWHYETKD